MGTNKFVEKLPLRKDKTWAQVGNDFCCVYPRLFNHSFSIRLSFPKGLAHLPSFSLPEIYSCGLLSWESPGNWIEGEITQSTSRPASYGSWWVGLSKHCCVPLRRAMVEPQIQPHHSLWGDYGAISFGYIWLWSNELFPWQPKVKFVKYESLAFAGEKNSRKN